MTGVQTCALPIFVFSSLQADVDGDVLLVMALYSKEALDQAETILPSNSFLNYANGEIRNQIIEDFIFTDEGE